MDNIIKKGNTLKDPTRESLVAIKVEGTRSWATPAPESWIGRLGGGELHIVRRRFDPPQTVKGKVTQVLNQASGERHDVTPTIKVHGVAEEKLLFAAQYFHQHYDAQETALINAVDEILQRYIASDSDPIRALFEPGVNKTWDHKLRLEIRERLGLDVRIDIADDPIVSSWIKKIRGNPARGCSFEFRPLNAQRDFKLLLSFRIDGVAFKHWNALCNRAEKNLSIDEEMRVIGERIQRMLNPLFAGLPAAALSSTNGGFWLCLGQALSLGVGPEIGKEFGCNIEIKDVIRDKSNLETGVDKSIDPETLAQLDKYTDLRKKAMDHWGDALRLADFNTKDPMVSDARTAMNEIDKEIDALRKKIASEHLVKSVWDDTPNNINILRDAMGYVERRLNLKAGSANAAILIEDGNNIPVEKLANGPKNPAESQ